MEKGPRSVAMVDVELNRSVPLNPLRIPHRMVLHRPRHPAQAGIFRVKGITSLSLTCPLLRASSAIKRATDTCVRTQHSISPFARLIGARVRRWDLSCGASSLSVLVGVIGFDADYASSYRSSSRFYPFLAIPRSLNK